MRVNNVINDSDDFISQYISFYESLGKRRVIGEKGIYIYDLYEHIGVGTISMYKVFGDVIITIYSYRLNVDVSTTFNLSSDYFELEYCHYGKMYIQNGSTESQFNTNNLSISLNQAMQGKIIRKAKNAYEGVAIVSKSSMLHTIYKDDEQLWNATIDKLSYKKREQYYLGEDSSVEIANSFKQILQCRLPYKLKSLYFESKITEILILIISKEIILKENIKQTDLTEYELRQITKVPNYLMEHRYDLPSLQQLSVELGLSEQKLVSGFKLLYEDTIFSYHRNNILRHGSDLLIRTTMTIDEIARELAYSNASNFVVAFKNKYEITPLKYRESSLLYEQKRARK